MIKKHVEKKRIDLYYSKGWHWRHREFFYDSFVVLLGLNLFNKKGKIFWNVNTLFIVFFNQTGRSIYFAQVKIEHSTSFCKPQKFHVTVAYISISLEIDIK